jgi:ELWxxDGT repeat protein
MAGTVVITDVNPGRTGLRPEEIAPVTGKTAMFSGDDGVHGREPWVTNGTTAGTAMYEDLCQGPAGSDPANITPQAFFAGIVAQFPIWYFSANDGTHGREFFVAYNADPPAEVYDIKPRPASSDPGPFDSVAGETGFLAATTSAKGRELFDVQEPPPPPIADGSQPGTATAVAGVSPGLGSNPLLGPTNQIGLTPEPVTRTYFAADLAGHGRQLWQADEIISFSPGEIGTVGFGVGGVRLVDGIHAADPADLTSVGGSPVFETNTGATELFSANDRGHGRQLWYSDGWSSNTHVATHTSQGPVSSNPEDITVIGRQAYFTAIDPRHGRELWKLTVPPAPQMFLLGPAGPVKTRSAVTFTAMMQRARGARQPSGRVSFYEDGAKIGSAPLTRKASGQPTA